MPHVTLNCHQETAVEAIARGGGEIAERRDFVRRSRKSANFRRLAYGQEWQIRRLETKLPRKFAKNENQWF